MPWPFETDDEKESRELRERIQEARVHAREAQAALSDPAVAEDVTPEGAKRFTELLRVRDEADEAVVVLQTEWENAVSKRLPRGRSSRAQPMIGVKAAHAFVKALGLGQKSFTEPSGAVLLPSLFVEDVWGAQDRPPAVVFARFPQVTVEDGGSIEYLTNTVLTPNAAPVLPLAVKPTTIVTLKRESKPFSTIATVSEPIDRHVLEDAQVALDFLGRALSWAVAQAVDFEIINGDGSDGGFVGLLNAPGRLNVGPPTAGQTIADVVLAAIAALEAEGYQPRLAVLSPSDWLGVRSAKDADENYLMGGVATASPATLWGVDVVPSSSLAAGQAIVVDTARAAKLYVREVSRLSWTESGAAPELGADRELFSSDAVRFRCETRLLLGISEPAGIAVADTVA
jgi:HK97 family phage major capsid protein